MVKFWFLCYLVYFTSSSGAVLFLNFWRVLMLQNTNARVGKGVCGICMCLFLPGTLCCLASVVVLHLNDAWIVHGFGPSTVFPRFRFSFLLSQHWLTASPRLMWSSTLTGLYTEPCTLAGRITDRQVDRQTRRSKHIHTLRHTYTVYSTCTH